MSITRKNNVALPFVQAITGAIEGAATGATGASVLQNAGYPNLSKNEAAAGAVGGAILGLLIR